MPKQTIKFINARNNLVVATLEINEHYDISLDTASEIADLIQQEHPEVEIRVDIHDA